MTAKGQWHAFASEAWYLCWWHLFNFLCTILYLRCSVKISVYYTLSWMSFNAKKSSVMWFPPRSQWSSETPPVILDGSPLMSNATQKYLGVVIDNVLRWSSEDGILLDYDWFSSEEFTCSSTENACTASCTFLSPLRCACLGASLSHNSQSRLEKMLNHAVRVVYGLRKFDHVSTSALMEETLMAFCSVTDPAPLSTYVASTLPCWKRKHNTVTSTNSIW